MRDAVQASGVDPIAPPRPITAIERASRDGIVVAVVDTEKDAQDALRWGADDVVLYDEAQDTLARALERARLRSEGRAQRIVQLVDVIRRDDRLVLQLLSSALGRQLLVPLMKAEGEAKSLLECLTLDLSERRPARCDAAVRGRNGAGADSFGT
jgi:DNA-binding NarL/FixJ family response regulator